MSRFHSKFCHKQQHAIAFLKINRVFCSAVRRFASEWRLKRRQQQLEYIANWLIHFDSWFLIGWNAFPMWLWLDADWMKKFLHEFFFWKTSWTPIPVSPALILCLTHLVCTKCYFVSVPTSVTIDQDLWLEVQSFGNRAHQMPVVFLYAVTL